MFPSTKEYIGEINSEKPDVILPDKWNKYLDELKRRLAITVEYDLISSKNPLDYFYKLQKNTEIDERNYLRNKAYTLQLSKIEPFNNINEAKDFIKRPKPSWIQDRDYEAIIEKQVIWSRPKNSKIIIMHS